MSGGPGTDKQNRFPLTQVPSGDEQAPGTPCPISLPPPRHSPYGAQLHGRQRDVQRVVSYQRTDAASATGRSTANVVVHRARYRIGSIEPIGTTTEPLWASMAKSLAPCRELPAFLDKFGDMVGNATYGNVIPSDHNGRDMFSPWSTIESPDCPRLSVDVNTRANAALPPQVPSRLTDMNP